MIERHLSNVTAEHEALQEDYKTLSEQISELNAAPAKVDRLKFYNQVLLFALLASVVTVIIVIFKTGLIEIVIEEEGPEIIEEEEELKENVEE